MWEDAITKFTESVSMHQIADVEVGCFLSSGVDSSYVVKEISKGTKKVKTFSVGYEEEKYSELPYAQDFSNVIGVPNASRIRFPQMSSSTRCRRFSITWTSRCRTPRDRSTSSPKMPAAM